MSGRQLALPFVHVPGYDAADWLPDGSNEAARTMLDRPACWASGRLAIWGGAGVGKTHLLRAWASVSGAAVIDAGALRGVPGLPRAPALAVDDAELAAEQPLLHLLNTAAEAGMPVALASRSPPARWTTRLPDLSSRLRASASVALLEPGEDMLRALLARLLSDRQLAMPDAVQAWLLSHLERTPAALREAVARLDRASLATGRRVTRPLAESVLGEFAAAPAA